MIYKDFDELLNSKEIQKYKATLKSPIEEALFLDIINFVWNEAIKTMASGLMLGILEDNLLTKVPSSLIKKLKEK